MLAIVLERLAVRLSMDSSMERKSPTKGIEVVTSKSPRDRWSMTRLMSAT